MGINNHIFLFLLLSIFASCGDKKEEQHLPPVFKSSVPMDGETEVYAETAIEVVFDEVISLASNHNITINNETADVRASLTKLIFTQTLSSKTVYNIHIPEGAVVNTFGVKLQDAINISFTTEDTDVNIEANLSNPNATAQAVKVYNFLKENYGIKSISAVVSNGAMDTNEAEWVKYHTGKYPAMLGFDYIFLNWAPANWIDYNQIDVLKNWWNNKGLLTASWHWNIPPTPEVTDYRKFTFRLENEDGVRVNFKPSNVPIEGTWENEVAKADFDELIGYIKLLQNENIPLIWRPLHEAAGNIYEYNNGTAWFWWGMEGGDAYVELWRYMYDYFKAQGVNNLIWVWTTQTKDADFYPGDAYVDIVGKDIYNNTSESEVADIYRSIQKEYNTKLITLSELGNVATMSGQWDAAAKWSWFMPWCDHDRTDNVNDADFTDTDHEFANAAWWINAMNQSFVLSRDEMPDLN